MNLNTILEFFKGIFTIFYNGLISYKVFFKTLDYFKLMQIIIAFISAIFLYKIEVSQKLLRKTKPKRINL